MRLPGFALLLCLVLGGCGGGDDDATTFACGDDLQCMRGLQYCHVTEGATPDYARMEMLGICRDDPRCECLADLPVECSCEEDPTDVLTATCPAP